MTSRSKGKQPIVNSEESDSEPEGVYQHTRTRTGALSPIDYNALAHGIRGNDSHSAVIESQASNSSVEKETSAYMVDAPEETARRIEQMKKHQMDIIASQQRSIDTLKHMLEKLLDERGRSPPRRPKGKGRKGDSPPSEPSDKPRQFTSDSSKSSSQVRGDTNPERAYDNRMSRLKQRLEALTNRKGLQEAGVVRPYPAEWDLVPPS